MFISKDNFTIYFSGSQHSYVDDSLKGSSQQDLLARPVFNNFNVSNVIMLEQVHGAVGYCVLDNSQAQLVPYSFDGDYSVTTLKNVALVIETADCVPVILVDIVRGIAAIAHAGWRGAIAGIVSCAVRDMLHIGSKLEDIQIYMGPAARGCCYGVTQEFPGGYVVRDGKLFFDNVNYIREQLLSLGVKESQINSENALCTICNTQFCSYRREGTLNLRQMSVIALK